jgi:RNA-directed DNA polymerase
VILCRSEVDAQRAYRWLQETARALKLVLHPEKTRIVDLRDGADGFDFLGFNLHMVRSRKYGKWYCQRWPSGRAMAAIRDKIKATTAPRSRLKQPIGNLVAELTSQIDEYVWERLALFDSRKRQKAGRKWGCPTSSRGSGRRISWSCTPSGFGRSTCCSSSGTTVVS